MEYDMKILFVFNSTILGGANRSTIELLCELRSKIEIVAIFPGEGKATDMLKNIGIKIYVVNFLLSAQYDDVTQERKEQIFTNNIELAINVTDTLKSENVQLIYTNSSTGDFGAFLSSVLNIPHIWHIREFSGKEHYINFYDQELKMELLHAADQCLAVSHSVAEQFRCKYQIEPLCLYNGLSYEHYFNDVRTMIESEDGKLHLLYAGGLNSHKGVMDVLSAARELLRNGFDHYVIHIVGDTEKLMSLVIRNYLNQYDLDDYIDIVPTIGEIMAYRKMCGISLTCSKAEALGRVTIEAMMAGQVVIGANTCGTLELIGESEERGYLYQQGNGINLAETILRVLRMNTTMRYKKMLFAQEYAREHFNICDYAQIILKIIQDNIDNWMNQSNEIKRKELWNELVQEYQRVQNNKIIRNPEKEESRIEINRNLLRPREAWKKCKRQGFRMESYLLQRNIRCIALYGMGYFGMELLAELENSRITVKYLIDKKFEQLPEELLIDRIKKPNERLVGIDALIITTVYQYTEIAKLYENLTDYQTIALRDILKMQSEFVNY
jgi:glycosyltransferase involved in cell wall biosynthesis